MQPYPRITVGVVAAMAEAVSGVTVAALMAEAAMAVVEGETKMSEVQNFKAAKALLVNEKGQVLILREAKTYTEGTNHGKYGLPGGRLKQGEEFEDGLRREVKEESGVTDFDILDTVHRDEWYPSISGQPCRIVGEFVVCKLIGEPQIILSSEHDDAKWIEPSNRRDHNIMPRDDVAIDNLAVYLQGLNT